MTRKPERLQRYSLSAARVGLSAYRLLTHILASKPLGKLCTGHFACGYDILRDNFEEQEIQHLLVELAISYRIHDDGIRSRGDRSRAEEVSVGKLWEPIENNERELFLRKACNKIIHAESFEFDRKSGPLAHERFAGPLILLYGHWQDVKWKAELNMLELCESLSSLPS